MKKGLRVLFFFALLLVLVACGDREIPTFDDILDQTVDVGSEPTNWETLIENLSDNESSVDALEIQVDDNVDYDVPGTYTVTITVTDENDNTASFTFNVTVEDNVKPVITLNGDAAVSIVAGESFTDPGATYSDNVDGTGSATVSGNVNTAVAGSYTLTYSYTDTSGNAADAVTRTVTVIPVDTQAPTITLNGEATLNVEAGSTFTDPGATFSDNLDGTGNALVQGSVDTSALGSYTLTYTYTDNQGNAATPVTRTVNVVDTTAPVITVTDATLTIEVGSTFTAPTATASDNLDSDASVAATGTVDANTVGSYTLTYTHSDSEGNAATAVTVTVNVVDTTAPVITLNGEATITVEAGSIYSELGATATDNYDASATVSITGTVDTTALGAYTVTYTSTDASGNVESITRTVNVVDTTAPTITVSGGLSVTVQINEAFTTPEATFSDNLDATGTVTSSGTVDTATVGTYTITYTATDASGNTNTVDLIVTVSDTPPRLAQYAPEDDSTFGISRYYKFGTIEAFLLMYDAKTLLVIFDGQEVIGEMEFGIEPMGPDSAFPTEPVFEDLFAISVNGLLIQAIDFNNGNQVSIVYNLNTKQVDESLPAGYVNWYATGPNQGPTSYLTEFEGYYYIVKTGDDRGLYTFNADLTLTQNVIFPRDYNNVYFQYKDDTYTMIEVSSHGETYYQGVILLETATNEILQTYDNWVQRYLLGDNFVISYYDNTQSNNRQVLQVWSSPTEMTSEYVENLYFFLEETTSDEYVPINKATALATTFNDNVNQERQVRIYDETFTRVALHTYGSYSWSLEQVGDYIVVLDRDVSTNEYFIRAFKNDGSDELILDDFGMTTTYQNVSTIYLSTDQGGMDAQPFNYLYVVQGWDDNSDNSFYKAFYFEDGAIQIFDLPGALSNNGMNYFVDDYSKMVLSSYESEWDSMNSTYSNTLLTAHIYDFETETLMSTSALDLGVYIGNTNKNFAYTDGYVLFTFGADDSYSTIKHFVLYDMSEGTLEMGSLETPVNQSYINNFSVEGDVVTISFNSTALITSLSDFGTFTEGEPTYGGGGSVFDIPDILNTDDLLLEMEFGEMGPTLVITLNGTEILSVDVSNTSYQVYVYDVEGTENDTIFIGFRQAGYVIDLFDPGFTEYYGVITSAGFLTLDDNYNESFDALPVDSSMYFNIYEYYVYN